MEQITCALAAVGAILVIVLLYASKEDWRERAGTAEEEASKYLEQLVASRATLRYTNYVMDFEKARALYWQGRAARAEGTLVPQAPVEPPKTPKAIRT